MAHDVTTLTQAVELMAAGSWAIETALRCLDEGDADRARAVLLQGRTTVRVGLGELGDVLEQAVHEAFERPARLAAALESLEELRDLAPDRGVTGP